jgi:hypothetical protein
MAAMSLRSIFIVLATACLAAAAPAAAAPPPAQCVPSANVGCAMFTGTCTIQEAMNNQCDPNQIGVADQMVKPQILTFPNLPPGTYTAMVIDFGPNNESGNVTISLAP